MRQHTLAWTHSPSAGWCIVGKSQLHPHESTLSSVMAHGWTLSLFPQDADHQELNHGDDLSWSHLLPHHPSSVNSHWSVEEQGESKVTSRFEVWESSILWGRWARWKMAKEWADVWEGWTHICTYYTDSRCRTPTMTVYLCYFGRYLETF